MGYSLSYLASGEPGSSLDIKDHMNIIEKVKWLFYGNPADSGLPPVRVDVPMPPVKPPLPEPSCFIKGIAASIIQEPDAWLELEKGDALYSELYGQTLKVAVRHRETDIVLRMWKDWYLPHRDAYYSISLCLTNGHSIATEGEVNRQFLIKTILEHPIGQLAKERVEKAKQEAVAQKAVEHFNKLGCPEKP
jgi:hypothetical protein